MIILLVTMLKTRGTTINNTMDNKSVPHGIFIFPTFNKKLTIGIYAIKIIKSLLATCT